MGSYVKAPGDSDIPKRAMRIAAVQAEAVPVA
jgi:hypothetical protein